MTTNTRDLPTRNRRRQLSHRAAERHSRLGSPLNPDMQSENVVTPEQSMEALGAPLWFQNWNKTQFLPSMDKLENSLNRIHCNISSTLSQMNKDRNSKLGDDGPFDQVAFPDGRKPWGAVVHVPGEGNYVLPALMNTADIQALTLPESYGYFIGYYPHQPVLEAGEDTLARRIVEIAAAIGRRRA